ncbi:MAG TPA: PQQ-binding-like beta-propeller repeat protein, partial [Sphingobacterium sp.]|nr:PQQ-binding-like beta-propeller repeat protein [Sphingobacterium sp.]
FQFALVTDTHIGGSTGADDLRRTVADLNSQSAIDFVILSGDVTEFGSDEELALAKQILDSLHKPLYIIPGNHDSNWSESGANSFRQVFGAETFFFEHKGYQFVGTTSGPNMRMSPGQVPYENLVWMDSVFREHKNRDMPLIAINHYPLDSSLNNWFDLINRLKTRNVQLALCGHGHQNKLYDWEGITGVMCRSNLRAKEEVGAYNIVTITGDSVFFQNRKPLLSTENYWLKVPLKRFDDIPEDSVKKPDYSVNDTFPGKIVWSYQDHGDIGAGMDSDGKCVFVANTVGEVYALDIRTGEKKWAFKTGGKVYSSPAYAEGLVVFGSSDHLIYGLDAKTGRLLWSVRTGKSVLGSPVVSRGKVYIGGSDGVFRCLRIKNGSLVWSFNAVKGYVSTLPTLADGKVIFGSWENGFYALDQDSGALVWEWVSGHGNRMFSPAACYPVVANNRVFIVAPDRYMTALDLKTGEVIWREKKDDIRVRESIGLSPDRKLVYAKTMDGELIGVSTQEDEMSVDWKSQLRLPYEIAPTAIFSSDKLTFVPSHSGLLSAVDSKTGVVVWQYKISNGMINPPLLWKDRIVVSTMDGKVAMLTW